MTTSRLFIPDPLREDSRIVVGGDRARYVGRALRLRPGDELTLFDGRGREFRASIESLAKDSLTLSVAAASDRDVESPLRIHLLQGLARGERMDVVIQKATELGVTRITPVTTEYSVVRLDDKRAAARLLHWQGIAASACEQCGRNRLPNIDAPTGLRDWIGACTETAATRVVMLPGAAETLPALAVPEDEVAVLIGPEGGLSPEEAALVEAAGFLPVGFGPRVLRTETAAVAVLTGLQLLYGDLA